MWLGWWLMGGWRRRGAGIRGWVIHISSNNNDDFLLRSIGLCEHAVRDPAPNRPYRGQGWWARQIRPCGCQKSAINKIDATHATRDSRSVSHPSGFDAETAVRRRCCSRGTPSYVSLVSLSYHYQRNPATKDVGRSDHRHAMPEGTDSLQIYSAISCEATAVSWQKQVIGVSALLLRQRPIDRASRLETFMIARLRTAQVR
jgi:hypothetical protein